MRPAVLLLFLLVITACVPAGQWLTTADGLSVYRPKPGTLAATADARTSARLRDSAPTIDGWWYADSLQLVAFRQGRETCLLFGFDTGGRFLLHYVKPGTRLDSLLPRLHWENVMYRGFYEAESQRFRTRDVDVFFFQPKHGFAAPGFSFDLRGDSLTAWYKPDNQRSRSFIPLQRLAKLAPTP